MGFAPVRSSGHDFPNPTAKEHWRLASVASTCGGTVFERYSDIEDENMASSYRGHISLYRMEELLMIRSV